MPPSEPALLYCTWVVEPPADALTDAQVPSPRQYVDDDAEVPLLRLVTGKFPVTPVDNGNPVAFVSVPLDGVPSAPPLSNNVPVASGSVIVRLAVSVVGVMVAT
jgi:hypothetical protein